MVKLYLFFMIRYDRFLCRDLSETFQQSMIDNSHSYIFKECSMLIFTFLKLKNGKNELKKNNKKVIHLKILDQICALFL